MLYPTVKSISSNCRMIFRNKFFFSKTTIRYIYIYCLQIDRVNLYWSVKQRALFTIYFIRNLFDKLIHNTVSTIYTYFIIDMTLFKAILITIFTTIVFRYFLTINFPPSFCSCSSQLKKTTTYKQ